MGLGVPAGHSPELGCDEPQNERLGPFSGREPHAVGISSFHFEGALELARRAVDVAGRDGGERDVIAGVSWLLRMSKKDECLHEGGSLVAGMETRNSGAVNGIKKNPPRKAGGLLFDQLDE
jgi:hypothetical protein